MANRTFGVQTFTGSAQPLIGDVTTAAVTTCPREVLTMITVASTAKYQVGDRIVLEPFTVNYDPYKIASIISSTVLGCVPEQVMKAHANGVILQLDLPCADCVVQPVDGGAGAVYIGSDNTVTSAGGGNTIQRLDKTTAGVEANSWHMGGGIGANVYRTSEAWMAGTLNDTAYVYAAVI